MNIKNRVREIPHNWELYGWFYQQQYIPASRYAHITVLIGVIPSYFPNEPTYIEAYREGFLRVVEDDFDIMVDGFPQALADHADFLKNLAEQRNRKLVTCPMSNFALPWEVQKTVAI